MVNTVLLNNKISESGLKKSYIIDTLDISAQSWNNKINNRTKFKKIEEYVLIHLLPFRSTEEIDLILHANDVK